MAPKRGTKQTKVVNNEELYKNLALTDALCPICRYILILPVTLPCNHNFCNSCFQGTVANANLTCPLCRVRFASWLRIAKKEDKIVNCKLWLELQTQFSEKVRNRQNGIDENFDEVQPIKITSPGEIRKEYEMQIKRQDLELQRQRETEEAASAETIKKLKEQDDFENYLHEEKLKHDGKLARKMAQEIAIGSKINNTPKKRPLDKFIHTTKMNTVPKANNEKYQTVTDDQTIITLLPQDPPCSKAIATATTSGLSALRIDKGKSAKQKNLMNFTQVIEITDSNDSIENECRYFKPIDHRNIPPSFSVTPVKVPAIFSKYTNFKIEAPNTSNIQLHLGTSAFVKYTQQSRKRKISENSDKISKKSSQLDSDLLNNSLKYCKESNPLTSDKKLPHTMTLRDRKSSNASPTIANSFPLTLMNGMNVQHEEVRLEQERKDLEFAKKLQEEFNKERYTTRSSISCRSNIKKTRQLTLTEMISRSKCK